MYKGLILSDIDRTLCSETGEINDNSVYDKIKKMQQKGWIIGLNSDTSRTRIAYIKGKFGFNGPIVSERGNAIHFNGNAEPIWHNETIYEQIKRIKQKMTETILELKNDAVNVTIVDKIEDFSTLAKLNLIVPHVLLFANREYSFSLSALFDYGDIDPADFPLFQSVINRLNQYLTDKNANNFKIETYPKSNFAQIFDKNAYKGACANRLIDTFLPDKTFMIGDWTTDNLRHPDITQLAVGNAHPEYKTCCQHVSKKTITQGFIDCLNWIENNH